MGLFRDFRYALRALRQNPGYTLTAISVLALGIGANTAIFSVVYAVILRPLPYPDASRLVFVWQRFPGMPEPFSERMFVARQNYLEWQRQNTVFQEMGAFSTASLDENSGGFSRKVSVHFVSANLFHLLGTQPQLSRLFREDEQVADRNHVAVLSDLYFERRFHRDPKALGKTVVMDGTAYTVIGALPSGFYMPSTRLDDSQADVVVPLPPLTPNPGGILQVEVVARLRPGVSLGQARAEMSGIAQRLERREKTDAEFFKLGSTSIFPFSVEATDPAVNRALYLLLGAVGFLLLIACANLGNLTLARATLRSREIMVRLALGATRDRIVAQLISESLLVGLAGAAFGVLLAWWSIRIIVALKPPDIEHPELIAINLPVLAFAAAAAGLTAILFGLGPALAVSGADLGSKLKAGGGWGSSATRFRSRQFLIASEVALAAMLLIGAGLMIRSLQQIAAVGVGFDTTHLIALDVKLPEKRYPDVTTRVRLVRDLLAHARAISGVADAAVTSAMPLRSVGVQVFHISGRTEAARDAAPLTDVAQVSPEFLQVVGLRLEAGRWLTEDDLTSSGTPKNVAIVNRAFARKYFAGKDPLGRRLLSGDKKVDYEIVGVVSDYRAMGAENGARPEIFQPSLAFTDATLVVRSRGAPQSVERLLLDAALSVTSDVPADRVKRLDEDASYWTSQRRFNTRLLEIFAALALVLAVLGIYGVLSNLVTSRTREIGIRMAIGATPGAIARLVLRQSLVPLAIGLTIGLSGSIVVGRFMGSLLFQVRSWDPLTLAAAVTAILLTSPAALWLPVRRATAVDCTVALRDE